MERTATKVVDTVGETVVASDDETALRMMVCLFKRVSLSEGMVVDVDGTMRRRTVA